MLFRSSELKEKFPGQDYFFIMGADSLFDFEMWKNPDIICRKASILAAIRDDIDRKELNEQMKYLKQKYHANIFELNTPNFSVSSHNIRNRVENGASIRYLLPDVVISYIREHNLYQEKNDETKSDRH